MKQILLLSLVVIVSCNPYRRIAGDQDRKPFERVILLQECEREAPPYIPGDYGAGIPTFDSTNYIEYIKQLELGMQSAQEEYANLSSFVDSMDMNCEEVKGAYKSQLQKLSTQIERLKNIPPVIKTVPIPCNNTAQLELLRIENNKLKNDIHQKDQEVISAKSKQKDAEDGKKANAKYQWMFWGLVALIAVCFGVWVGRKFS